MATVNRRSRVLEGECLECLVECFEEAYASEPQRYKNTACTACFGPLLAPVAVVERATWEAQFQLAAWNELGRDWRLSNAAKSFQALRLPLGAACQLGQRHCQEVSGAEPGGVGPAGSIPRARTASAATAVSLESAASCVATSS